MPHRFILTDLAGTPLTELAGARGKSIAIPVNGMATSAVTVRGDSEDADHLLGGDRLLRVYEERDDGPTVMLGHHRLVTAEEVADGNSVSVAAAFADPFWVLLRRLCGKSNSGFSVGTAAAPWDRGSIIVLLVGDTNADSPTGVAIGSFASSSTTYVSGWFYKKIGEAIAELAATLDGPDWRVRPQEIDAAGVYGLLDVLPTIGTYRPDAAWEYGDGLLNARSYRRMFSLDGAVNRAFSLPSGFPDNAISTVLRRDDARSQGMRGVLEDVVPTDLTVDDFRAKLLDHHLAVRANGRQTITFEPARDLGSRLPRFGIDFDVGDTFPFKASIPMRDGTLLKRIDAVVRLYSYSVTVDDAGASTPSLSVTPT